MLIGESRRGTQADNAAMGDVYMASPGIDAGTDHLVNNNKTDSADGHKREGEKLAEHTIVYPRCCRSQVTMTAMLHAIGTFRCYCSTRLMHMER